MKTASLLTLASCAAAQLYIGSRFRHNHQGTERVFTTDDESQISLSGSVHQFTDYSSSKYLDKSPIKTGSFTKTPQDNTTCATYGESQWSGTVDVTDTRRLFYWAFESRNDPANDPVIFWMNGGPGSTSTTGLFIEMGPCWLPVNETVTEPNPWSWNNNATVVFLEQPAGVGLSVLSPGAKFSTSDQGGAEDFQTFLNIFYQEVFPEKKDLPIILSAESYGGHYGPTYLNHILESRRYNGANAFRGNITGLILVDALLEFSGIAIGMYELLCETEHAKGIINETACNNMALALPEVERLGRICTVGGSGSECFAASAYAETHVIHYYQEKIQAGERSPFSIHRPCIDGVFCPDLTKGNTTQYLNQPHIKEALHLSPDFQFEEIFIELNTAYTESNDIYKSTMPLVGNVLDAYRGRTLDDKAALGDIKVLVLNGNDDAAVNSAATKWLYDHLPWSGFAQYRAAKWRELEDVGVTGDWKATRDGRLALVTVDEAGHMVPGDQREGSFRILQKWMQGEYHF